MGRGRKKHRHRKNATESATGSDCDKTQDRPRKGYSDIVKENEKFEKYYKLQGIIPPEEWDSFMEAMRENLPATFRITGYRGQAKALLEIIKGQYFGNLLKLTDENIAACKPICLPWYPGDLAWQMKFSRVTIRQSEELHQLHNFLVSETDTGNISRQETVSMIPPLLLNVEPHHKVLDMCAAPGSKTAQLIELLHKDEGTIPKGIVVANDVDNKRCYMLVHQAKRLNSPCMIILNHDASKMPDLKMEKDGKIENIKFDRILCDVPCSGDGTIRKAVDIWKKWNTGTANGLHVVQIRILKRGLELLAVGGRLVYSTCSLNPIENEAVISTVLQQAGGAVELVDASSLVPGLKWCPGLSTWKVISRDFEVFDKVEDVPAKHVANFRADKFPPSPEVAKDLHLEHCMRILPHHQDTGGFFVAVLEKRKDKLPWETDVEKNGTGEGGKSPPHKKRKVWGYKEDPFVFLEESDEEIWPSIRDFYALKDFPSTQILSRCKEGKKRNLYFVSNAIKKVIQQNGEAIKIINTGLRMFCRSENRDKDTLCTFRLTQEGVSTALPFVNSRQVQVSKEDLVLLLRNEYPANELFTPQVQERLAAMDSGCVILSYVGNEGLESEFRIELCGWKGKQTVRSYVPRTGKTHYLRICGEDVTNMEDRQKKKFKIKLESSDSEES